MKRLLTIKSKHTTDLSLLLFIVGIDSTDRFRTIDPLMRNQTRLLT